MRRFLATLPLFTLVGCLSVANPPGVCIIMEDTAPTDGTPQDRCVEIHYNDCQALAGEGITLLTVDHVDCASEGYTEACGEDADGNVIYTEAGGCETVDTGA